jgi:ferric-dicitrate binding protein FerR (iron transport regulator)
MTQKDRLTGLIIRYLAGEIQEQKLKQSEEWISYQFPDDLLELTAEVWNSDAPEKLQNQTEDSWNIVQSSIRRTSMFSGKYLLRIAALLVLAFMVWWLLPHEEKMIQITNTKSEPLCDTLPDGSIVWLKQYAEIAYNPEQFNTHIRELEVKGELFFNVTANKDRPFVVLTSKSFIRVTGTSFNVVNDSNFVEVYVKEGSVQFSNLFSDYNEHSFKVDLRPGDIASYKSSEDAFSKSRLSNPNRLAWQTGIYHIRQQTLENFIIELENTFNVCFLPTSVDAGKYTVRGNVRFNTINDIIDELNRKFSKKLNTRQLITIVSCTE